jgi:UDP-glucose 4-epimerase
MKNILVTGGAGFIGSNLCDRLLHEGNMVVCYDNFSTGKLEFLRNAQQHSSFKLVKGDLLDLPLLTEIMTDVDLVVHFAANADVRFGLQHPRKDLEQNTIGTFNVLEAMRLKGVKKIAFSSTGSVYGEASIFPTPEDAPMPIQTSLYGASKLAGEALISAYCEGFGFQSWIFRFVSVLGERYTHGHVFDFYRKLKANPLEIEVLGNGKQRKSYMYVQDCIDAMLLAFENTHNPVNVINLGTREYSEVADSLGWICQYLKVEPEVSFTGGERGWIGDNPFIFLDTNRINSLGWTPKKSIKEGVIKTLEWFGENDWVFETGR